MKPSNRVHREGGKKAGLPQAQTQPGIQQPKTAGEPSQASPKGSAVTIRIEHPSGRKFCQFDLERDVFARVEQASLNLGLTIPQFIIRCAEEKIRRETPSGERTAKGEGQGNVRLANQEGETPTLSELLLGEDLHDRLLIVALLEGIPVHELFLWAATLKLRDLGVRIEDAWVMEKVAELRAKLSEERRAA